MFRRFFQNADGATAIEYALIAAAMAVALVAALPWVENSLSTKFSSIGSHIDAGK